MEGVGRLEGGKSTGGFEKVWVCTDMTGVCLVVGENTTTNKIVESVGDKSVIVPRSLLWSNVFTM